VQGIVKAVLVRVGEDVKKADALFVIDSRELDADLAVAQAEVETARLQLARLEAGTRQELIPPAKARIDEATAQLKDLEEQLSFWQKVGDSRAVSEEEMARKRNAVLTARTRVEAATAELKLLEAGTWAPDILVSRAQLAAAQAGVDRIRTEIERRTIVSPVSGRVLQVKIREGEFATASGAPDPLMIVGVVNPLHIRVEIDEHETWRLKAGAEAVGFVKGNKDLRTKLNFVRFEPYVVPKKSLTGESTERVDTRVLQVLYAFDSASLPVFIGQQMDVYISADPVAQEEPATPLENP
jgi:multidrug resistance efflux pump